MSNWGRGDKGKATRFHSLLVRSRGACEKCGERDPEKLQCAHIISRRYSHTRTDLRNAFCLCAKCHMWFTAQPVEFGKFVFEKIGEDLYDELLAKSQWHIKMNWNAEATRLAGLWEKKRPVVTVAGQLPDLSGDPF